MSTGAAVGSDAEPRARCCVLVPYFEAGPLLLSSVASVDGLGEGLVDVLVVDDGSSRVTARETLRPTAYADRVEILELAVNRGIAAALNEGLRHLAGRYELVARLDCGDTCVDHRLATQVEYLDAHPQCMLVGTWTEFHTPAGEPLYTVRHPVQHEAIMRRMHVNNAFTHASVMFRAELLGSVGAYPEDRPAAEDHAYFFKIGSRFETANIPHVHVRSLLDPYGISSVQRRRQIRSRIAVLVENFDGRPVAVYGLIRACLQLLTPRTATVLVRTLAQRGLRRPRD